MQIKLLELQFGCEASAHLLRSEKVTKLSYSVTEHRLVPVLVIG